MKNDLKKLFKKLPGVNGQYKQTMIVYYGFLVFFSISTFLIKEDRSNLALSIFFILLVLPSIAIGFKNMKRFSRNEKLNYIVYPGIFIILINFIINSGLNNNKNFQSDALKELGINESEYKETIERYENLKVELNNNTINEDQYKLEENNYKKLESSYENLKAETAKKEEVYNELLKKKAEKEEQEKIVKAEAERKAKEEAEKARLKREEAKRESSNSSNSSSKNNQSNNKNNGTFKPNGGTASHDHRTGYDSPSSDPNKPQATSDYGYVASGNSYVHKTPDCKFIRGKATSRVSVSASGKHTCNCWRY
ncbi:TPA: cell envelope integrity protein TolA [Clostridium perfringens]|uniref:cell envelope integrity protein TolA n=1 Tax=Clostridium perfringens TaxID=1502 RepID=UPI0011587066|nr:cell envelope integrity protein TolA [Clostridium perfringens]MDU2325827.1 cell envelope integrity protein TolA [Clostridium perfringens]HAT4091355.1 cell envelope integrity protein TolA [Clostridium perfringens]HAT4129399.1 cell envelope integrity protein TolA [Clostridium perfringens]